jgi:hypothetical protein
MTRNPKTEEFDSHQTVIMWYIKKERKDKLKTLVKWILLFCNKNNSGMNAINNEIAGKTGFHAIPNSNPEMIEKKYGKALFNLMHVSCLLDKLQA